MLCGGSVMNLKPVNLLVVVRTYFLRIRVNTNSQNANARELKILTYEIKNKAPVTFIGRMIDRVFTPPNTVVPFRQPQKVQYPGTGLYGYTIDMPWPKVQFSIWLEGIKQKFAVGDLVTMATIPVIPNVVPMKWEITYINELHKDCKFDADIKQPICITVRFPNGVCVQKCPATLRKLTTEELALVELSDKKPGGTA